MLTADAVSRLFLITRRVKGHRPAASCWRSDMFEDRSEAIKKTERHHCVNSLFFLENTLILSLHGESSDSRLIHVRDAPRPPLAWSGVTERTTHRVRQTVCGSLTFTTSLVGSEDVQVEGQRTPVGTLRVLPEAL